jgi:hypothetical protein
MECPRGKIKRNSYTKRTSTGKKIKVSANCIVAMSQSGKKRSDIDRKILSREKREHTLARKKFGTPECASGEIVKEGYHKKASSKSKNQKKTWVAPTCIEAKGSSKKTGSKGKKLFRLEKGTLSQFGYHDVKKLSQKERRKALSRAITEMKPLSVRRKLIAVSTLQKNTDKKMSKIFKDDAEWIKQTSQYKKSSKTKL